MHLSPWLVVSDPLAQADEPVVSDVSSGILLLQDALMTFCEVQRPKKEPRSARHLGWWKSLRVVPQGRSESQETLQLKLLRQGRH